MQLCCAEAAFSFSRLPWRSHTKPVCDKLFQILERPCDYLFATSTVVSLLVASILGRAVDPEVSTCSPFPVFLKDWMLVLILSLKTA